MTTITALPAAPTRGDPATFAATADTFLSALPAFGTECNAVAAEMSRDAGIANSLAAAFMLPGYRGTSTSSVTFGTGTKVVTTQNNLLFVAGMSVTLSLTASATSYMQGTVTSYSGTTLTLNITSSNASGTYNDWQITPTNTNLFVQGSPLSTSSVNGGQLAGFRNALTNGNFTVWQRGTTFSSVGYGPDRWKINSISNTTVSQTNYTILQAVTSSAANSLSLSQCLDWLTARSLYGKPVTLSLNLATSGGTESVTVAIQRSLTPADSNASWTTMVSQVFSVTGSSLQGFALATAIPSDGTAAGVRVLITTTNIANGAAIYVSRVQLEVGTIATPFEYLPYAVELAICQRYCHTVVAPPAVDIPVANGWASNTTIVVFFYQFPVEMRVSPALYVSGSAAHFTLVGPGGAGGNCTATPSISGSSSTRTCALMVGFSGTGSAPWTLRVSNGGWMRLEAEL